MKKLTLSLAAAALIFLGCSEEKQAGSQAQQQRQMPPLPVQAHTVTLQKAEFSKNYSAILKPFSEVAVVARVSGLLVNENFTEGALVKKGDLLYEIEKDEYEADLDAAKAAFLKAEANFKKTSKDWERALYLYENKAISEQQHDDTLYAYEDAKAELQRTKAALKNAQIQYDYTTIKAPISGIVGMSQSDEGSYIASQNATLTTITALDPIYAEFSIPSSDIASYLAQIKVGSEITLQTGTKTHKGIVDYIAPKLDSNTDTLLIRAKVNNPQRELVIGSFAEVTLSGFSFDNVAEIPQNTLIRTPEATLVYVIQEGAVTMKPVQIAHTQNGKAIISSGLNNGDQVVTSNIAKLRPQSKVTVIGGK